MQSLEVWSPGRALQQPSPLTVPLARRPEPWQTQKAICVCQVLRAHASRAGGRALQRTPPAAQRSSQTKQKNTILGGKGVNGEVGGGPRHAAAPQLGCTAVPPRTNKKSRAQQRLFFLNGTAERWGNEGVRGTFSAMSSTNTETSLIEPPL
jgi:hypothetical protein